MSDTAGQRLIKKYPNRRLYDTEQSRYITLDELSSLVRDGAFVRVVDAREGTDLTRQVLTQVILEQQDRLDVLPVELLHLVIRVTGTSYAGGLASVLKRTFEPFSKGSGLWTTSEPARDDIVGNAGKLADAWMQSMRTLFAAAGAAREAGAAKPPPSPPTEPSKPEPEPTAEAERPEPGLDALRDRMASLLDRLRD